MTVASNPRRFGVLGSGEVGQTLAKGLATNGYDVRIGTRTPGKLAQFNPTTNDPPEDGVLRYFTGPNESLMERLQAAHPRIAFVKAFNSVGSDLMVHPLLAGGPPTMFYCGNDAAAKAVVARILEQFGWDSEDMGGAAGSPCMTGSSLGGGESRRLGFGDADSQINQASLARRP